MHPTTLVWIDAREAIIARHHDDEATQLERVASEVPAHRRSTGHVRHRPPLRHGGGGSPQTAGEPHRLEHLERFIGDVANRLPATEDVLILGPGTVREHLERRLCELDAEHGRQQRIVRCQASGRLSDRQLVARLRIALGIEPRRRTVGAYRWNTPLPGIRRGVAVGRRLVEKRPPSTPYDS